MKLFKSLSVILALFISGQVMALTPTEVKQKLILARPDLPIAEINPSKLKGFYEVVLTEGTVLFVNEDASYFLAGDLYRIDPNQIVNVTEEGRNAGRQKMLAAVNEEDMIIFSPAEGKKKTSISVFTDLDCGYCRKLHKEVPELNRRGIEVRYLAYPRAGIGSDSYKKYVSAWCADNKKLALTQAKLGIDPKAKTCDNPVADQFKLGSLLGVTGTPAIVFEDGTLMPGYLPAAQLAQRLGVN